MTLEESIRIEGSSEKVFSYLMDINNRKNYIPALEEVILLDPLPIQKGSRYIEVANIAGRRLETTYQVFAFELNKRISAKTLESIFPIQADLKLVEEGAGTDLIIELDFKLRGVFRLASAIVGTIVRQQAKTILLNIKQELEKDLTN